jgi:hypothetical protein
MGAHLDPQFLLHHDDARTRPRKQFGCPMTERFPDLFPELRDALRDPNQNGKFLVMFLFCCRETIWSLNHWIRVQWISHNAPRPLLWCISTLYFGGWPRS